MTGREVEERSARGEVARIYHEVRQTLRVSGVNQIFRIWATRPTLLGILWEDLRPNLETRAFEDAADHVRSEAVAIAESLGAPGVREGVRLGETEAYQLCSALELYHYIDPKLLVMVAAVHLSLDGALLGTAEAASYNVEGIGRGVPAGMAPMEMVPARPSDPRLERLLGNICRTMALEAPSCDYRTLALWPSYLEAAWERLKPVLQNPRYRRAVVELEDTARTVAQSLPHPMTVTRERLRRLGEDADRFVTAIEDAERVLSQLVIQVALWSLDWQPPERLRESPFLATLRIPTH